jgi:sugar-specific transcriptional regulator TrmB
LGESSASDVCKFSGIHPRSTYDALEALIAKGLVTYAEKEGVRSYAAGQLDSLIGWVEERRAVATQLLPILEKQRAVTKAPLVRIFRGLNGMRAVWEELLRDKQPIYFFGGAMQAWRVYLKNYMPLWNKRREKLQIPVRFIFLDVPGVREAMKGYQYWRARPMAEKRVTSVPWWRWGNKFALIFTGEDPLVIIVENEELAKSYMSNFEYVWKTLKDAPI